MSIKLSARVAAAVAAIAMSVAAQTTWTGASSNAWHVAGNWTNGVPTSGVDATIPAGVTNAPVVSTVVAVHTLTVDGSLGTAPHGSLTVSGDLRMNATATWDLGGETHHLLGSLTRYTGTTPPTLAGSGSALSFEGAGNATCAATFIPGNLVCAKSAAPLAPLAVFELLGGATVAGSITVQACRLLSSGNLNVSGSLANNAGSVDMRFTTGAQLSVDGDLTGYFSNSALVFRPNVRCGGSMTFGGVPPGQPDVPPQFSTLTLDGFGATTLDVAPGAVVGRIRAAGVIFSNGMHSTSTGLSCLLSGGVQVTSGTFRIAAGTFALDHEAGGGLVDVFGTLDIAPGAALAIDYQYLINIRPSGTLHLVGTPAAPAVIREEFIPPGGGLQIDGHVAAENFSIVNLRLGVTLGATATIAAAPEDFRAGSITGPSGGYPPNGQWLSVAIPTPVTFHYLSFGVPHDSFGGPFYNVYAPATSGGVTLVNYGGALGGPAFENDPFNKITWAAPEQTTLAGFTAQGAPDSASIAWATSTEVDVAMFELERATNPAGPFTAVASAAPGAFSYAVTDYAVTVGTTYTYRLQQVLTHGVRQLLATGTATPYSSALPANVLAVGGGGPFATIQDALNVAPASGAVIGVAPGTYPAFHVDGNAVSDIRIVATASNAVFIDTTTQPLQISDVAAGHSVVMSGLVVGSAASAHDGVRVTNCTGTVVLSDLAIAAGPGADGVHVDGSTGVALQRTSMTGGTGLRVDNGGFATACLGSSSSTVCVGGGAEVTAFTAGPLTEAPAGSLVSHTGAMPQLGLPDFVSLGQPVTAYFTGEPLASVLPAVFIGAPRFASFGAGYDMALLLPIESLTLLNWMQLDASGNASLGFSLFGDASLLGLNIQAQFVSLDPITGTPRFSTLATFTTLP